MVISHVHVLVCCCMHCPVMILMFLQSPSHISWPKLSLEDLRSWFWRSKAGHSHLDMSLPHTTVKWCWASESKLSLICCKTATGTYNRNRKERGKIHHKIKQHSMLQEKLSKAFKNCWDCIACLQNSYPWWLWVCKSSRSLTSQTQNFLLKMKQWTYHHSGRIPPIDGPAHDFCLPVASSFLPEKHQRKWFPAQTCISISSSSHHGSPQIP